ncbi:MAG: chemotaxis protein CheA, partial [Methylophaga nitratireducenticrescens]
LADPLVHLVRNAVDHGVEMPDAREAAGKPKQGQIVLAAAQEGDHILLTISDDGAGMNPEVLRRKAVEKGMMDEEAASRLTESECFALIFAPGFSMKQEISDISGRGVGMDVVKTSISKLNGVIDIQSEIGKGTTLSIKVPLTLAIMPTLMVMLGNQIFAFPLVSVNEIFNLDLNKTNTVDGQQTVIVRNKALPLFYLRKWLNKQNVAERKATTEHVVIVNVGTRKVGFVVDQLIGQEEVVIKPLGALLHGTKGFAGATITGDGRIALILDFPELMNTYAHRNY